MAKASQAPKQGSSPKAPKSALQEIKAKRELHRLRVESVNDWISLMAVKGAGAAATVAGISEYFWPLLIPGDLAVGGCLTFGLTVLGGARFAKGLAGLVATKGSG